MSAEAMSDSGTEVEMQHVLLVIAAEPLATELRRAIREYFGIEVHAVGSFAAAKGVMETYPYSLAVADWYLPDAPGGEAVDYILHKNIPVIVMTSDLSNQGRRDLLNKGIVDYIFQEEPQVVDDVVQALERTNKNRKTKILVVDPHCNSKTHITKNLQAYLFTVLTAESGEQALHLFDLHNDIKVAIIDFELQDMDGVMLCSRLRAQKNRNELAIIGISSVQREILSARFLKKGANDFLPKPFQREELYGRLLQNLETQEFIAKKDHLLHMIQRMNQRMKRDMEAAAEVQQRLLPYSLPEVAGVAMDWFFQPCEQLAGDALGVFRVDGEHLGFYVLDVSGHGVPAALLAVSAVQTLQLHANPPEDKAGACLSLLHSPKQVMELLDREFPLERFDKFLTIVYGVLNTNSGCLEYSVAGHPPPLLVHREGGCEVLDTGGSFIGLGAEIPFESRTVCLYPGDKVLFYSDGVSEMVDEEGREFGFSRLQNVLETQGTASVHECMHNVRTALETFGRHQVPRDDISLLCLGRLPLPDAASSNLRPG